MLFEQSLTKAQGCDVVDTETTERPSLHTVIGSSVALSTRSYKVPSETKLTPRVRRIIERRTIASSFRGGIQATELLVATLSQLSVEVSIR